MGRGSRKISLKVYRSDISVIGEMSLFCYNGFEKRRNFFESDSVRLIYISIVYFSLYRYTITQVIKGDYNVHFIHEKYFKILRFGRQT